MKCDLFPFQKNAVNNLRDRVAESLREYNNSHVPQVVSLQAPTGAGKTIIMTALIEDIFNGTENFIEQPEAIFIWLSDSPDLNEQSRKKIEDKADKIKFGQCKTIKEDNFDQEVLDDGFVYFLNTQKINKTAKLCSHSDNRQYTIWETIQNTMEQKADRLYMIIDEAHRGTLGNEAGKATSIMQRFIKGYSEKKFSPMPVVIGMSATAQRFNKLIGECNSTLRKWSIKPADVRSSGLLKDHILLLHPEDNSKFNEMSVLENATKEWMEKCKRWYQYSYEQHYSQVNPIFVVQVQRSTSKERVSDTDLDEVIRRIEKVSSKQLDVGEVVHTFGSCGDIELNGLKVKHIDPVDIADDKKIKIVLFKENLSTGWDCPRAEAMMSFSTAEDPTYIAQLLGRMVRTPLQRHIQVDESLNEVQLYLPYFNAENCVKIVKELQSSEVDDFPVYVDESSTESYGGWASVHVNKHNGKSTPTKKDDGQIDIFANSDTMEDIIGQEDSNIDEINITNDDEQTCGGIQEKDKVDEQQDVTQKQDEECIEKNHSKPQDNGGYQQPIVELPAVNGNNINSEQTKEETQNIQEGKSQEQNLFYELDREDVIKYIIDYNLLTYTVRNAKISSYLKSVLSLAELLNRSEIFPNAFIEVSSEMVQLVRDYINKLKVDNEYESLKKQVLEMKLAVHIFDMFGEKVKSFETDSWFSMSDENLDPQLRIADTKMGSFGLPELYNEAYYDIECPNNYKIDCILFAVNKDCMESLETYAKDKFFKLKDTYRIYLSHKDEKTRKKYDDIVADADLVSEHSFRLPERVPQDADGENYEYHLFADEDTGFYKAKLNGWEKDVLAEEFLRDDFACWIRNPSRGGWALTIPYEFEGEIKPCYPDFIIIRRNEQLRYVVDILEPHRASFTDNLAKAKGLVRYVQKENRIGRIQMIRKEKDKYIRLDLSGTAVQGRVLSAQTIEEFDNIFKAYGTSDTK